MHVLFTSIILRQAFNSARAIKVMKFQLSWLYIDGMSQQNIHVEAKELQYGM
jgi:hypothetical protein